MITLKGDTILPNKKNALAILKSDIMGDFGLNLNSKKCSHDALMIQRWTGTVDVKINITTTASLASLSY